jgi:hypothetical protein
VRGPEEVLTGVHVKSTTNLRQFTDLSPAIDQRMLADISVPIGRTALYNPQFIEKIRFTVQAGRCIHAKQPTPDSRSFGSILSSKMNNPVKKPLDY